MYAKNLSKFIVFSDGSAIILCVRFCICMLFFSLLQYCLPVLFQTVPNSLTYLSTSLLESLEKKGGKINIFDGAL